MLKKIALSVVLLAAVTFGQSVSFSTYIGGGASDTIRDVVTDSQGNVYITGGTASANFPATLGSYDTKFNGTMDVFVSKFTPTGSLVWSTFLGGPNYDRAYAIEVDGTGVYVGGRAGAGFPTTSNAPQRQFAGDNNPNAAYGAQDGFITKISLDGKQLLWSTYVGDTGRGFFRDIALDGQGSIYGALTAVDGVCALVGPTGIYDATRNGGEDGIVVKLNTNGGFTWATYFGGSGMDEGTPSIRADASGVYLLGLTRSTNIPTTAGLDRSFGGGNGDMHLAKFSPDGRQLLWGTYIGGANNEFSETHGLALDHLGNTYVAVTTKSSGLATSGAFDTAFNVAVAGCSGFCGDVMVAKFNSNGVLQNATYFGGNQGDEIEGVGVDASGNVYIGGTTYSTNLPMAGGSYQTTNRGNGDAFVAKFNNSLSQLFYSSYFGGSGMDSVRGAYVDALGNIFLAGHSKSGNFPVVHAFDSNASGMEDGILVKFATH